MLSGEPSSASCKHGRNVGFGDRGQGLSGEFWEVGRCELRNTTAWLPVPAAFLSCVNLGKTRCPLSHRGMPTIEWCVLKSKWHVVRKMLDTLCNMYSWLLPWQPGWIGAWLLEDWDSIPSHWVPRTFLSHLQRGQEGQCPGHSPQMGWWEGYRNLPTGSFWR